MSIARTKKGLRSTSALAAVVVVAGMLGATGLAAARALATTGVRVTTTSLAAAPEGAVYRAKLAAAGGVAPYTWSITTGTLPDGLTLVPSTGLITGIPSIQAPYDDQITVQASASENPAATATATLSIQVQIPAPMQITTASLPEATADVHYSQKLAVTGGAAPYSWSITDGTLPDGLTLDPDTGVISGSPKAGGDFRVTVQVSSPSWGKTGPITATSAPATLTLTVNVAALSVTTGEELPPATLGVPYSVKLGAFGGITPFTWALTGGAASLPPGLKLHPATGVISGTPTVGGDFGFSVNVTDSEPTPQVAAGTFDLEVASPLTVTSTDLGAATAGSQFRGQLTASGGTASYTWSLYGGSQMPAGLTLYPDGSVSGIPAEGGTVTFMVEVTDASSPALSSVATVSIEIGFNIQG